MSDPVASSSKAGLPASTGGPIEESALHADLVQPPYPASQAQILRAHQRDTAQVSRLTELVSEVIRSFAGTRWLAHKQLIIDVLVKATYLFLTLGRAQQTLGEEYTDILPQARRRAPSARRRFLAILLLLLPSIATAPATSSHLRQYAGSDHSSFLSKFSDGLARFIESPLGQSLPEIQMLAFLFGGRFLEFGRRLSGMTYISTLPSRPNGSSARSYEPLGILLALPILYRLLPRRILSGSNHDLPRPTVNGNTFPMSPPLTPPLHAQQAFELDKIPGYDTPNTYLTADAVQLPERQCTLCLEPRGTGEGSGGTVAVTECGHVFCWGCLGGLEKAECPLCRQSLRMERLIAAYNL